MSCSNYIICDVGGDFQIIGLPPEVNGATEMNCRLVTKDSRLVTGWVPIVDGQKGNDWANGVFVAFFEPTDFVIKQPLEGVELHVTATVSGVTKAYKSRNTITVECPS